MCSNFVRLNKPHSCCKCGKILCVGEEYLRVATKDYYCTDCACLLIKEKLEKKETTIAV